MMFGMTEYELAEEAGQLLKKKGLTLGVVESATGGLIGQLITGLPGSSDYFTGGIIAYSNEIKQKLAGVGSDSLEQYGAVSSRVAEEMAAGGRISLGVDICIADTGIAGPGGASESKPVGLFYLGLADAERAYSRKHFFAGSRQENRLEVARTALAWLVEYLESG